MVGIPLLTMPIFVLVIKDPGDGPASSGAPKVLAARILNAASKITGW
ncbi:hypothetical protein [Roseibium sp. M-1]